MKNVLLLFVGLMTTCAMVWAQDVPLQEDDAAEADDTPVYPTTGVRFVACNPSDVKLPPTLYAAYKDDYLPIYISTRGPSERVLPNSQGHVLLYDTKPQEADNPGDPYLDIALPPEAQKGRVICIVLFTGEKSKPQFFYIRESELPVGGFYVFNFSPVAVEMVVVPKLGQVPDKGIMISAYKKAKNNCISPTDSNVWSLMSKKHPELNILEYVLRVPPEMEGGTPMPLRSSRYAMKKNLSHVTVIVRHPTLPQAFRLVSFSYNSESDKRNTQNAAKQDPTSRSRRSPRRNNALQH